MFVETTVSSQVVYEGKIFDIRRDVAALHNGKEVQREVVVHTGGVVILPVDKFGNAYMVRQFRYGPMMQLLEACAGKLEKNEDPKTAAIRELKEETGFTADTVIDLGISYPSPGYCAEVLHHYLALELHSGDATPDIDEFVAVEKYPFTQLVEMAENGDIIDGKTIVTLLRAAKRLL